LSRTRPFFIPEPLRGWAVRPSKRPSTRITARAGDENRLKIKFLCEARESWLSGSRLTELYAEPDDSFHPDASQHPGILGMVQLQHVRRLHLGVAGVELATASEPPARKPRIWGRRPAGVDPSHPEV